MIRPKPMILIILDGFGYRVEEEANAIFAAKKPCLDELWNSYPHTTISGSGECVGLPHGQMGNSEVGHMNIGAGRIVYQDLSRIDLAIANGDFFKNSVLLDAFNYARKHRSRIHILGLLSSGGVHSHESHFHALVEMAVKNHFHDLIFHCFLDGRDTPPKSAETFLSALATHCQKNNAGKIGSIIGRFYAMDRDKRYERVKAAYDLLTGTHIEFTAESAMAALEQAYLRGETDEFVKGTLIQRKEESSPCIQENDVVIFMNFRSDRARQLTDAFISPNFNHFKREITFHHVPFITLTNYDERFSVPVVFNQEKLTGLFGEFVSAYNLKQLRLAETEKYAHVTFFFNGGKETPLPLEDRILIPSPKVPTYDLQPEMSAYVLTDTLVSEIEKNQYDVIICNFANADMVGHSGNFAATVQAIEVIDTCLDKIIKTAKKMGGEVIITADHGNAEMMHDPKTGQPHTAHTADPVPFIYIGREAEIVNIEGKLSDIAPTMLYLMGLPTPKEMTGQPLVRLKSANT